MKIVKPIIRPIKNIIMCKGSFIFLLIVIFFINYSSQQVVCSQDKLIKELYEDIIDNGFLKFLYKVDWTVWENQ